MSQSKPDAKRGSLSDALLFQLSEFVANRFGLHFPQNRWRSLERNLLSAAGELGFDDVPSCVRWLISALPGKHHLEVLAAHLTVGETYFFREQGIFDALQEHVLPERIRSHQGRMEELRIWSAGCSTGEEPYSVAILLDQMMPLFRPASDSGSQRLQDHGRWMPMNADSCFSPAVGARQSPPVSTILATDINVRSLRKASEGIYGEWSFRGVSREIRERYFTKTKDGRYELLPAIRKRVNFSPLNLVEDHYPSLLNGTRNMDVIFCRNVLMYFEQEGAQKVIQRLYESLTDGGWLIVSPSEMSHLPDSLFIRAPFPHAVFYRKVRPERSRWQMGEFQTDPLFLPESSSPCGLSDEAPFFSHPTVECGKDTEPATLFSPQSRSESIPTRKKAEPKPHFYQEALTLYKQGRYEETIQKLTDHFSMTESGWRTTDGETADTQSEAESFESGEAVPLLIQSYANQGKLKEALAWSEKAVSRDKFNPKMHYLHASILQEQGRMEDAAASLRRAFYLDSCWVPAHFALGHLMRRQGKIAESLKHFQNALALLANLDKEHIVPELDGITAGRLTEIIRSMIR